VTSHDGVPVVTFDGPSGSGKGTLSRALALDLGWHLLDSGALYRLVALAAGRESLDPDNKAHVTKAAELARRMDVRFLPLDDGGERVELAGEEVTRAIRSESVGELASYFAAKPAVREGLLALQRHFRQPPGLVADGRDMGTVVFPDARLKLYVTASAQERARRRHEQLLVAGSDAKLDRIYREILARDARDRERPHSPLRPAVDAIELDTTELSIEQTMAKVRDLVRERFAE